MHHHFGSNIVPTMYHCYCFAPNILDSILMDNLNYNMDEVKKDYFVI